MVKAGLKAIYLSGWQVAADANLSGDTYPDQSLYPANSAPALVRRLNNALIRADQVEWAEGAGISVVRQKTKAPLLSAEQADPKLHEQAWAAALVLIGFVLVASLAARALLARSRRKLGQ